MLEQIRSWTRKVLSLDPGDPEAWRRWARLLRRHEDADFHLDPRLSLGLRRSLEAHPEDPDLQELQLRARGLAPPRVLAAAPPPWAQGARPLGTSWVDPASGRPWTAQRVRDGALVVRVPRGGWIDVAPVSAGRFEAYLRATGRAPHAWFPEGLASEKPATFVTLEEARGYARWAGGRLPFAQDWKALASRAGVPPFHDPGGPPWERLWSQFREPDRPREGRVATTREGLAAIDEEAGVLEMGRREYEWTLTWWQTWQAERDGDFGSSPVHEVLLGAPGELPGRAGAGRSRFASPRIRYARLGFRVFQAAWS